MSETVPQMCDHCVCGAQLGLTMQAMYPERMYRCFIVNVPSFFAMLWRVMDPLMTERVKKKISIFRTVWPRCLRSLPPSDSRLPAFANCQRQSIQS